MAKWFTRTGNDIEEEFEHLDQATERAKVRAYHLTAHSGNPTRVDVLDRHHQRVGTAYGKIDVYFKSNH